jgi:hypothetical protein
MWVSLCSSILKGTFLLMIYLESMSLVVALV